MLSQCGSHPLSGIWLPYGRRLSSLFRTTMSQPVSVAIPKLNKSILVPTGLFINNEFVPSVDSKELIQYV